MIPSFRTSLGAAALALTALAGISTPAVAQDLTFSGQIRPRFESRTPVDGNWDPFTSMRTRLGLLARLDRNIRLFAQVQDVRLWGEESNTLTDFSADGFDLHQGYVDLGFQGRVEGFLRAGRQEISLGGQRLVGAVGWSQPGRSFDGLLLKGQVRRLTLNVMATKISENSAQNQEVDADFSGVYGSVDLGTGGDLDLYWLFNRDSRDDSEQTSEHTAGARWVASPLGTDLRLEGSVQTGSRAGEDVEAFMLGARWGASLGSGGFGGTLWYDYLSGDESLDDGKAGTFNPLYGTNHKFYGFYDLFLNIPAHTGRHGLQDLALKAHYRPEGAWEAAADFHRFQAAQERDLSTGHLADELDLSLRYRYSANATLTGGYSYVWAADGIREIGRLPEDGQWLYLMLDVTF
jgi:hypothetical protein